MIYKPHYLGRWMNKMPIDSFEGEFEFLSNFSPSPIEAYGLVFPTVEHFFQALKAKWECDFLKIAHADTPGQAKRLGRRVELRDDWEEVKLEIMRIALEEKFSIPELQEKLLATGDRVLIEGNWWHDNFWGNCNCELCERKLGKNHLGKLLMELRAKLKEELAC